MYITIAIGKISPATDINDSNATLKNAINTTIPNADPKLFRIKSTSLLGVLSLISIPPNVQNTGSDPNIWSTFYIIFLLISSNSTGVK